MNRIIGIGILLTCLAASGAEQQKSETSDTEKAAKREEARQRVMEKTGGLIRIEGKGLVAFVNLQDVVPVPVLEARADLIAKTIRAEVRTVAGDRNEFDISSAPKTLEKAGATVAVFLVDRQGWPMSLTAVEARWALVNVAALNSDSPSSEILAKRVNKMLTRQSALLLGTFASSSKSTPLVAISSLSELDALDYDMLTMDSMIAIFRYMPQLGITQTKMTTYKKACMEGWAPAPTNDFQKAIFERVKADKERGPSKPLTIAPPAKK